MNRQTELTEDYPVTKTASGFWSVSDLDWALGDETEVHKDVIRIVKKYNLEWATVETSEDAWPRVSFAGSKESIFKLLDKYDKGEKV